MKTVLFISYVFPPTGGAGVQRVLKFVKYLPGHGWRPVVITPRNPSAPLKDPSYLADLPPEVVVRRLWSLEPPARLAASLAPASAWGGRQGGGFKARLKSLAGSLAFPDRHLAWLPTALPGALAAAVRHRARVVLVTGPPFSSFVLGAAVAGILGLPLVLDFRDEWSGFFSKGYQAHGGGPYWRAAVRRLEAALVGRAARVIGNTPSMTRRLHQRHGGPPEKYLWIPNGYDPDDFRFLRQDPPRPRVEPGRLHLLYTGTVFQSHPLDDLWAGLERLSVQQRRRVAVEIVGRVVPGEVADPGLEGLSVRVLPYEPHRQVLRRMASAGVLLLTLADLPGLESMVPAKLFEYLAVRRPVLAVAPPGEATRIVEATGCGAVVPPGRPAELAGLLGSWLEQPPPPPPPPPAAFDRRRLAGRLARLLAEAAGL